MASSSPSFASRTRPTRAWISTPETSQRIKAMRSPERAFIVHHFSGSQFRHRMLCMSCPEPHGEIRGKELASSWRKRAMGGLKERRSGVLMMTCLLLTVLPKGPRKIEEAGVVFAWSFPRVKK